MAGDRNKTNAFKSRAFEIRLLLALALTVILMGLFQYLIAYHETDKRIRSNADSLAASDVSFVDQAFTEDTRSSGVPTSLQNRLDAIASRPGTRFAAVANADGTFVAVSAKTDVATFPGRDTLIKAARSGNASKTTLSKPLSSYRYITPITSPDGKFALQIEQDASAARSELNAVTYGIVAFIGIGMLLGSALFFVIGGRSLTQMHRNALLMSSRDGLTGLENQITFLQALDQLVALSTRADVPNSLALFDVDNFKQINDKAGHRRGDEALRQVAQLLQTNRVSDRVFRIGGDEFAVIFPHTDGPEAYEVCRRIWRASNESTGDVTLSTGVATLTQGMNAADLHERADKALYEAKRRGRNDVVLFGGDLPTA